MVTILKTRNQQDRMMGYKSLRFSEEGLVTVVTLLTAPQEGNAIAELSAELSDCCRRFRMNDASRVLVLVGGSQDAFCIEKGLAETGKSMQESFSICEALAEIDRPVLAGITGDAIGLGLEIALACDVRVASNRAWFGLPHIKMDLMPRNGGTQRLLRTVGKAKAMEMILTGDSINAQEANRIGLVSRLVAPGDVVDTTVKMSKEMASKSPISLDYCKEAIVKGMDLTLEQGIRLEADLYFLMHTTNDRKEGIKSFLEKRKTEFKGN
jgi:enoyl-CoA hydratase/carnithine racemase